MIDVQVVAPGRSLPAARAAYGIEPVRDEDRSLHAPDRHLVAIDDGALVARASCWWTGTPQAPNARLGLIGHYAAAGQPAGSTVLARACEVLADAGCTTAVGPVDGSTWRRYRFVTERGDAPPFFLEPDNPDEWPTHWTSIGFSPLATYSSSVNDDLGVEDPRTDPARDVLRASAISFRSLDPSRAERELPRIFSLSLRSFRRNFLYTSIDEREFVAGYRGLLPHVDPALVLLAERADELVGFMFAVPDLLQAKRGVQVDTVILKTMAVDPSCRGMGLGGVLMDEVQRAARARGFRRAIHALMHDTNPSRALSDRYARPIRRYTLFSRSLAPA